MAFTKEKDEIMGNSVLWNAIKSINGEYAHFGLEKLQGEVIAEYEKRTSKSIRTAPFYLRNEFDFTNYLADIISDERSTYDKMMQKYRVLFDIYIEYESKVLKVFEEKRLYKDIASCPPNTRSSLIRLFMPSDTDRFYTLKHYEEEFLDNCTYKPKFPIVKLHLTQRTPWNDKSREYIYNIKGIVKSYDLAIKKERQASFARQQRALMSDGLRYSILKRDGFRCCICGSSQADGVKLEVDHIIPVSKGGKTIADNLQTLCERCNRGKGNSLD